MMSSAAFAVHGDQKSNRVDDVDCTHSIAHPFHVRFRSVSACHFALLSAAAEVSPAAAATLLVLVRPGQRPASASPAPSPPDGGSPPRIVHRRKRAGRRVVARTPHRLRTPAPHRARASAPGPTRRRRTAPLHVRRFASHRGRPVRQGRAVKPTVGPAAAEVARSPNPAAGGVSRDFELLHFATFRTARCTC